MSRYKKRGWFGESHRHYLAAKGIATKHFLVSKSRLPAVPIGAFGPSKTAFGRMTENVGALSDVRHKLMEKKRDKLASGAGEMALRRQAVAMSAAEAPSLEGLSNVRRLVDKETGVPLKDDATEEERANAVREKLSQFEQAMMSGLRPEQEVRKKEILADLGVGTSKLANDLAAFPRYHIGPGSYSELEQESMADYKRDLERNIKLEEANLNNPATPDHLRDSINSSIDNFKKEWTKADNQMKRVTMLDKKIQRSEHLSQAEQRFLGKVVRDLDAGKSHRIEDVEERDVPAGLNVTEYEQSKGVAPTVDVKRKAVKQFVKPPVKQSAVITESTPLDEIPGPKVEKDKHDFEV